MAVKIAVHPTEEPVLLDYARKHLIVDIDDDDTDAEIMRCVASARRYAEGFLNRALVTQTWDLYLDEFPDADYIELPLPPLQSVSWLKYKSTAGVLTTMDAADYIVDIVSEPGRAALAYGESWESTYAEIQAVQVRFICGYGRGEDVPEDIRQAIMMKAAQLYENRGDEAIAIPSIDAVKALLWPYRVVEP